ncbi:MAG TPA: hypothetical protein VNB95_04025, partial [Nitrososphaera sp.]|nr:hypothetical protein [Nitrososphaera sp.]
DQAPVLSLMAGASSFLALHFLIGHNYVSLLDEIQNDSSAGPGVRTLRRVFLLLLPLLHPDILEELVHHHSIRVNDGAPAGVGVLKAFLCPLIGELIERFYINCVHITIPSPIRQS